MGRTYAGVLGSLAFLTVLTRSLIAGGTAESTLVAALVCLFGFAALGYLVGQLADFIVWDNIRSRLDRELSDGPLAAQSTDAKQV